MLKDDVELSHQFGVKMSSNLLVHKNLHGKASSQSKWESMHLNYKVVNVQKQAQEKSKCNLKRSESKAEEPKR